MNVPRIPLRPKSYESDERHRAREYRLGLCLMLMAWGLGIAIGCFAIIAWAESGPLYALIPIGVGASIVFVIAMVVALHSTSEL